MYRIKQIPEDFIVKEISNVKPKGKGSYSYFLLKKRNYDTVRAVEQIAARLRIPDKFIGFAGNKDKRAVTEQIISIKTSKKITSLKLKDIELMFLGCRDEPVSLGSHKGNQFIVTVRNLTKKEIDKFKKINKNKIIIPNYFGEQRFSKKNVAIGKAMIKKDFKKACDLIGLEAQNNDYVGALRKINKRILKLYIHSYQSFIFNKTVEGYLKLIKKSLVKNPIKKAKIPIVGFGTELNVYGKNLTKIINQIIKKEKITLRDFVIKTIPELSSEGGERDLFIEVKDLKMNRVEKDDLNKNKYKIKLSFTLPKGCYATVVIKKLFNSQ